MPHLFDEWKVRGVTLRNRIGVSPMCQYSATDGLATDWHLVHLGSRAVGGAALVIMEASAIDARGRITPQDTGIYKDAHIDPLSRITQFIKEHGSIPGIQLAHAGRKASRTIPWEGSLDIPTEQGGWETVAPSALAFDADYRAPHALTEEEIAQLIQSFRDGAKRAEEAGFQWLELHGAHGYLLHSFLSPLSNQRTDRYGGSFENRIRFILEVARALRTTWPERLPLSVRLSCTDWIKGGWDIEETVALSRQLKAEGVDVIDASSGGLSPAQQISLGAGYQVPFAERIRHEADIATAAVGMITDPMQADELVRNGRTDLVLLARALLRDPYWPLHAAQAVHQAKLAPIPNQYLRAF